MTIIPEQEAFGHLHHNLTWEMYQPLAETPHGAVLAPGQPGIADPDHANAQRTCGAVSGAVSAYRSGRDG